MKPPIFEIHETDEVLCSQSGLAMVGAMVSNTDLCQRLNALDVAGHPRPEISHGDMVKAMIGLLVLGKPDFEAIEAFRDDPFFAQALGLKQVPSAVTLRQRLDALAEYAGIGTTITEENARLIQRHAPRITPCAVQRVALDVDVSPFDNSGTKKEGVSYTYKKFMGYSPIFAYLGEEGYLVNVELREGKQHCQAGTPEFLQEAIRLGRTVTQERMLVRMDSGNDDTANVDLCAAEGVDWVIKRNLRKESPDAWLDEAMQTGEMTQPRPGKTVFRGTAERGKNGKAYHMVFDVARRTSDAKGQSLLLPTVEADVYWSNLEVKPVTVVDLYHAHGTSEQYHSELKTDMDVERLPSGKFATNALVLELAMVAYNVLRIIGQTGLAEEKRLPKSAQPPVRKKTTRRRVASVMKDLIYMACRLTRHAGRWGLSIWAHSPWLNLWRAVYERICIARFVGG